ADHRRAERFGAGRVGMRQLIHDQLRGGCHRGIEGLRRATCGGHWRQTGDGGRGRHRLLLLRILTRLTRLLLRVLLLGVLLLRILLLRILTLGVLLLGVLTLLTSLKLVVGFGFTTAASDQSAAGDQPTESNEKKGTRV